MEEISHWFIFKYPAIENSPVKKKFSNNSSITVTPVNEKVVVSIEEEYRKGVNEMELQEKEINDELMRDEKSEKVAYDSLSMSSDVLRENEKNLRLNNDIELTKEVLEGQQKLECHRKQSLRCIVVVAAFSFHAIIEGLTIGLKKSISEIWYMFIANSIHSATILFCFGLELLLGKAPFKCILIVMILLAMASPAGVVLGLLVTLKSNLDTIAKCLSTVLLEGLSAGTILYIIFFEILNREKERRVHRLSRACFIIGGFSMMALLQALGR